MRNVHLYGHLAETFGADPIRLDVATAAEALRALACNFATFVKALEKGAYQIIRGDKDGDGALEMGELATFNLGRADLHIVPVPEGSKSGGGGAKILIGAALVGAAIFFAPAMALSAPLAATGVLSAVTYGNIAMLGVGIALAGVSSMLTSPADNTDKVEKQSFTMAGPTNVYEQGNPVPLVYGEVITGGVLVSVGTDIEDIGQYQG
jgi:predicted phage tail protein